MEAHPSGLQLTWAEFPWCQPFPAPSICSSNIPYPLPARLEATIARVHWASYPFRGAGYSLPPHKHSCSLMFNSVALGSLPLQEPGVGPGVCIFNQPTSPLQFWCQMSKDSSLRNAVFSSVLENWVLCTLLATCMHSVDCLPNIGLSASFRYPPWEHPSLMTWLRNASFLNHNHNDHNFRFSLSLPPNLLST